jgi:gamma-glutamylputrescine oxidase
LLLKKELGVIENSFYEHSLKRPRLLEPLTHKTSCEVCVIGGGYTGLSAALELAELGYSVILLEAQRIGWGASGRNGGQVIVGFGDSGEEAIEKQFSSYEARCAWDISVQGVELLKARIEKHKIHCDYTAGFLNVSVRPKKSRHLRAWADHLAEFYGYPTQWIGPDQIRAWIASDRYHSGVYDPSSGHLNPLKYCLGLAAAAKKAGVTIHENSPVYDVHRGQKLHIKTALGEVISDFAVLAGNVYLGEYGDSIAPEIGSRVMPVGTYMVATAPLGAKKARSLIPSKAAVSDNNFMLDYFRVTPDHRLLFGSGDSYSGKPPNNLVQRIRSRMLDVFPQLADVPISHAWGGFVDLTMNMAPDFGRIGSNIYYLQGFSGHGLAFTGMAGKLVAQAIKGQTEDFDLFSRIRHKRFPGGRWARTPALVIGAYYYRLKDML